MDAKTKRFLATAATRQGLEPSVLLARVLHLPPYDLVSTYFAGATPEVQELAGLLDEGLRTRNPGLQYVVRSTFIGFRREEIPPRTTGGRTQTFLSVIRRQANLSVVLPAEVSEESGLQVDLVAGKGHHGVGDTRVTLTSAADVARFFDVCSSWLNPAPEGTPSAD